MNKRRGWHSITRLISCNEEIRVEVKNRNSEGFKKKGFRGDTVHWPSQTKYSNHIHNARKQIINPNIMLYSA